MTMTSGGTTIVNQLIMLSLIALYYKLTQIEGGDDLHACVSARVPYLGPLVLVVVRLVANPDDLTKNSVEYPPLRNIGTRKKANAATILPVRHPVDGAPQKPNFSES